MHDDLTPHLDQARAVEAAQHGFRDRENRRHSGGAWSAMSRGVLRRRGEAELLDLARERRAAAEAWRGRPEGRFLLAMAEVQRAAARLHAGAEQARAGAARGLADQHAGCAALVAELRRQVREIAAGLRHARRALDPAP